MASNRIAIATFAFALCVGLFVALFPRPLYAQLAGDSTGAGDSCASYPQGATTVVADSDLDGGGVVLICDGSVWQAMSVDGGDADTLDTLDSLQFLRSDTGDAINVGRGDVFIESNANDNADGAGITLRTSANPSTGSMFAVRSSGQAPRLWVGQAVTSSGQNSFYVGTDTDGFGNPAIQFNTNGNIVATGTVSGTAFYHTSDARLKDNVQTISGLELVSQMRGVSFDWKKDGSPSVGVIAQEVETVMPSAVKTSENGMKSVEYDQIIGPLIEAVKELKADNDELRAELDALKQAR